VTVRGMSETASSGGAGVRAAGGGEGWPAEERAQQHEAAQERFRVRSSSLTKGDCGGRLYVQVLGGFVLGAERNLREVCCWVEVDGKTEQRRLAGKVICDEDVPMRQEHLYLKGEASAARKWWFGSLASACERGSSCPNPSACDACTRRELYPVPRKSGSAPNVGSASQTGAVSTTGSDGGGDSVLFRMMKSTHLWKPFHKEDGGEGSKLTGPSMEQEEVAVTFKRQEMSLGVKDYYGRLPVKVSLSSKSSAHQSRASLSKHFSKLGPTKKYAKNNENGERCLGTGIISLSDSLNYHLLRVPEEDKHEKMLARRFQVVRLRNPQGSVSGCVLLEMCFVPSKSKDKDVVPYIHDAVVHGQFVLVKTVLENLRRKQHSLAVSKRAPGAHQNMNAFELAAFHGQHAVLDYLLENSNTLAWNEWNNSRCEKGRTAMHMAVLGNNVKGLHSISMHAYKYEISTSLFDTGSFDSGFPGLYGMDRMRSAAINRTAASIVTTFDEDGRSPFMMACSLDSRVDAMPLVLSLLEFEPELSEQDKEGNTALMIAINAEQVDVALTLINITVDGPPGFVHCKARPNMPNKKGECALHIASEIGNVPLVKALLDAGALSSLRTKAGSTPLHIASANGHLDVVKELLEWPDKFLGKAAEERRQRILAQIAAPTHATSESSSSREGASDGMNSATEALLSILAADLWTTDEHAAADLILASQHQERLFQEVTSASASSSPRISGNRNSSCVRESVRFRERIRKPINSLMVRMRGKRSKHPSVQEDVGRQDSLAEEVASMTVDHETNFDDGTQREVDSAGAASSIPSAEEAIRLEMVDNETVSIREAHENRLPGILLIEWRSGKTASQLALAKGHADVFAFLKDKEVEQFGQRDTHKAQAAEPRFHGISISQREEEDDEDDEDDYEYKYPAEGE